MSGATLNIYEGSKKMIVKVSYKLKRTLPGQQYDYEELYVEDVQGEIEEPRSPVVMMQGCIDLVTKNTARARQNKGE
jgi:hypothetical protein